MVTGIDVTVVLDHGAGSAGLAVDAEAGSHPAPVGESGIEEIDEIRTHVVPDPLVEYVADKAAETDRADRPSGYPRPLGLRVDDVGTGLAVLPAVHDRILHMLHHGHELHVAAAYAFQKMIDLQSAALAAGIDRGHGVEGDILGGKRLQPLHDSGESRSSSLVLAELVVDVLRAVDRDSEQEAVILEETRPFAVDQSGVGLHGIAYHAVGSILALELHGLAVEVETEHKRLPSVPVEHDLPRVVRLDIFADHGLQHLQGHARLPAAVNLRLVEIVAVGAVEVAERARGFHHYAEIPRPGNSDRILDGYRILEAVLHCFRISRSLRGSLPIRSRRYPHSPAA